MPIRPIEIMKSQEASQIKQMESLRLQQEQAHSNKNFKDIIREDKTKTTKSEKSENKEYRYDAKEKGNNEYFGYQGKKKSAEKEKSDKDDEENKSKDVKSGGNIDILI